MLHKAYQPVRKIGSTPDLVAEAARQDARDRALEELGSGIEIPEYQVQRWLKKLGAL
jgi:hypothetical protein